MAKNYADIYNSTADSSALNQRFYIKKESAAGIIAIPTNSDFMFTLSGGSVNSVQPITSSPHRTGRHNTSVIPEKIQTNWSLSSYFNVDTSLLTASNSQIDLPLRVMLESALGKEDVTAGSPRYTTASDPNTYFSVWETGDSWQKQACGAFVDSANMSFPGDGQAQIEFSGQAKNSLLVGIAKTSVDNNGTNSITLDSGDEGRIPVGAKIMLIKGDGVTRSTDTPNGSARTVTAKTGAILTVDGAPLTDADGTSSLYVSYYEPTAPTGINNPLIGLTGSVTIAGLSSACVRSASFNLNNNHEVVNYCYGEKGLSGPLFVAGGRADVEVSLELNLNHELVEFINRLRSFPGENITLVLGDSAGRHVQILAPKVIFPVPEIPVPESGSIPITFTAMANQTAIDAYDELTISFL